MVKTVKSCIIILIICSVCLMPIQVSAEHERGSYIDALFHMLIDMYAGELDQAVTYERLIRAVFDSLDEYTQYYNRQEADVLFQQLENVVIGIGVIMTDIDGKAIVSGFLEPSPARDAGLMVGDRIIEVDGADVTDERLQQVAARVQGEEGTVVRLGLFREQTQETLYVEITRKRIEISPVHVEWIDDDIAYIRLSTFSFEADRHFAKALADIDRKGIDKIVVDVRNNGGGSIEAAVNIASHFIEKGDLGKLQFHSKTAQDRVYRSDLEKSKYKVAVLVNEYTASAAEMFASAIRDTGTGPVVGVPTFGKAIFQQIFPIIDYEAYEAVYAFTGVPMINYIELASRGIFVRDKNIMGYVKITVGEWVGPTGNRVHQRGVLPTRRVLSRWVVNDVAVNSLIPMSEIASWHLNDQNREILLAKMVLRVLGYDVAIEHAKLDMNMQTALLAFQREVGLADTGILDIDTQQTLNRKLVEVTRQADRQLLSAIELLRN